MSTAARCFMVCALFSVLALSACKVDTPDPEDELPGVSCDQFFWGKWVRMDGGVWNVGDTKVRVTTADGATTDRTITGASATGMVLGSTTVNKVTDNLLKADESSGSYYLFRGKEAGGFRGWAAASAAGRPIGLGGAAYTSLLIQNVLNSKESYTVQTDANGNFTVPNAWAGSIYSVTPTGGTSVLVSGEYGGLMVGSIFVNQTSYLLKSSIELPANQPFVFGDQRIWYGTIRVKNFGTTAATGASYECGWGPNDDTVFVPVGEANVNPSDMAKSPTISGSLPDIPASGSATIPIAFISNAGWLNTFNNVEWNDQNLRVTITEGGRTWEDSVPLRLYTSPLVLTLSGNGDMPVCLISASNQAHQFYFEGPVDFATLSVPRAAGWRIGISGAQAGAAFSYSLGVSYPCYTLDSLSRATVPAENSYELADSADTSPSLPDYSRVEALLSPGELDFYAINDEKPAIQFPIDEVFVQGGTFTMGTGTDTFYNQPAHQVTLSSFIITKYEVTRGQCFEATQRDPYLWPIDLMKPSDTFLPMGGTMGVSWLGAAEFCDVISTKQGLTPVYNIVRNNGGELDFAHMSPNYANNGWRLPTEAEWEYAARGGASGSDTAYSGSTILDEVAWHAPVGFNEDNYTTSPASHIIGMKSPNALGLYDMSGNAAEWVNDWADEYGYFIGGYGSTAALDNPMGLAGPLDPDMTGYCYKIIRGGSVFDTEAGGYLQIKSRKAKNPKFSSAWHGTGFRMVRKAP